MSQVVVKAPPAPPGIVQKVGVDKVVVGPAGPMGPPGVSPIHVGDTPPLAPVLNQIWLDTN